MEDEIPELESGKADDSPFEDPTGEMAALSRIPELSGGPRTAELKAEYLGYRSTGFPIRQALSLTGINHSTLTRWRNKDSEFAKWETEKLPELQSTMGSEIVRLAFLRNMRLALQTDFKVLMKAAISLEALTEREMKVLMRVRNMYGASDLMTITKALAPASNDPANFAELILQVTQTQTSIKLEAKSVPQDERIETPSTIIDATAKKA